jgi:hypothetical protein
MRPVALTACPEVIVSDTVLEPPPVTVVVVVVVEVEVLDEPDRD